MLPEALPPRVGHDRHAVQREIHGYRLPARNLGVDVVGAHELKVMAAAFLRRERADHTLQPTALVHEAYLRLVGSEVPVSWQGRAHVFGAAARAMRRILVDHARRKAALKRPPRKQMVALNGALLAAQDHQIDLIVLDDLLTKLARLDERMSQVVELRVFAGLRNTELAVVLGVSTRTVDGDWAMAKKWLRQELA